jgi:hypothetical protein
LDAKKKATDLKIYFFVLAFVERMAGHIIDLLAQIPPFFTDHPARSMQTKT